MTPRGRAIRQEITENQRAVLAILGVAEKPLTVLELLHEHSLGQATSARIAASLNTLVSDGLATYATGDTISMFTASYIITDQGRAFLAQV